jgi:hypothetical protein
MRVDEIRKFAKARPFQAFEICVENIFITNQLLVTVDEQGQSILIAPEAVSTIRLVAEAQQVSAQS